MHDDKGESLVLSLSRFRASRGSGKFLNFESSPAHRINHGSSFGSSATTGTGAQVVGAFPSAF
jgi:hypothetical protein